MTRLDAAPGDEAPEAHADPRTRPGGEPSVGGPSGGESREQSREQSREEPRWKRFARQSDLLRPVAAALLLSGLLHLAWAVFMANGGGDLAAQTAWTQFAERHPDSAYNLSWYGGMHPASYSVLTPYLMAWAGIRTTAVVAGTLSAALVAVLLVRSGVSRPMPPTLWAAFALWCNAASGRVTFSLGMLFAIGAVTVVFTVRGPRYARGAAVVALGVLSTLASPVAGLFVMVVAAALFLTGRRRAAYALAVGPPVVVAVCALLFPFDGTQPMGVGHVIFPVGTAAVLALAAPRSWRIVRVSAAVYAVGALLTWAIPSQVGTNVERMALLFAGVLLLAAARERKLTALWLAFAATAVWQVARPAIDMATAEPAAAWSSTSQPLVDELRRVHAERGRVEVVPMHSHREASGLAPYVNLARGWNRQLDVERHALFYDDSLTPASYHAWLRRWAVHYVVLPEGDPDPAAEVEADIVRPGRPWLKEVWSDRNWRLYRVVDPSPLADPPASVERAGDGELVVRLPEKASVLLRIPWSPWLGVVDGDGDEGGAARDGGDGQGRGCLVQDGEWTRLRAPGPGLYRIGSVYQVPRGTPC